MLKERSSSGLKEELAISRSASSPLDDAVLPQPELAPHIVLAELSAVTTNPLKDAHIAFTGSAPSSPQMSDVRSNSPAPNPAARLASAELTSPNTISTLSSEAWNELNDWTRPSTEDAEIPEADASSTPSAQVKDACIRSNHERLLSLPPSLLPGDCSATQRLSALSVRSTTRAPTSPLSVLLPPGASLLRMLSRASAASSTSTPSPWTPATPTWFKLGAFARSLSSLAAEERVEKEDVRVVSSEHSAEDGAIQVASGLYTAESGAAAHFGAKFGARIAKLRFGLPSNASQVLS
ncbi:hypothetical protein PENSPDRAFT_652728 [Peniophora sp. CONT]|nr:hypothetical protein PENSPDRAFT_652728 [Peniophora sp. CONT]